MRSALSLQHGCQEREPFSSAFAAQMAGVSEGEIIRRLIADTYSDLKDEVQNEGVDIFVDYGGHRTRGLFFLPTRVEIVDGPLKGKSFKSPTGAARAVVRHYNPGVDDNRNGWDFWQIKSGGGRAPLQTIRLQNNVD